MSIVFWKFFKFFFFLQRFKHNALLERVIVKIFLLKGSNHTKIFFVKPCATKKCPVNDLSQTRNYSQSITSKYPTSTKKILQGRVQALFRVKNIRGQWILFFTRFMPANDFVQPFAGINLFGHNIMVPLTGLEPVRYRYRGILSPLCLPIPPQRHLTLNIILHYL